jgi:hypothetical protein
MRKKEQSFTLGESSRLMRSCLCRASREDKAKMAVRLTGMEAKRGVRYSPWCALRARQVG